MKLSWASWHEASSDHAELFSNRWLLRRRSSTWSQHGNLREEVENLTHDDVVTGCLLSKMWFSKWSYSGRHDMKPHPTMQNYFLVGGCCWEEGVEETKRRTCCHSSPQSLHISTSKLGTQRCVSPQLPRVNSPYVFPFVCIGRWSEVCGRCCGFWCVKTKEFTHKSLTHQQPSTTPKLGTQCCVSPQLNPKLLTCHDHRPVDSLSCHTSWLVNFLLVVISHCSRCCRSQSLVPLCTTSSFNSCLRCDSSTTVWIQMFVHSARVSHPDTHQQRWEFCEPLQPSCRSDDEHVLILRGLFQFPQLLWTVLWGILTEINNTRVITFGITPAGVWSSLFESEKGFCCHFSPSSGHFKSPNRQLPFWGYFRLFCVAFERKWKIT
jgi:hypothetical protein